MYVLEQNKDSTTQISNLTCEIVKPHACALKTVVCRKISDDLQIPLLNLEIRFTWQSHEVQITHALISMYKESQPKAQKFT